MENRQELTGLVIKAPFAVRSKSEREAILLDTGDKRYVLRREGGNAFFDPVLEQLVGRKIRAAGRITSYTFLLSDWAEVRYSVDRESKGH
jgi:hypothetical protein